MLDDNIVAVSTPPGEGGIGIIRLSGDAVINLCQEIFMPLKEQNWADKPGYTLTLGWIQDEHGEKIDEVLLGIMRAPHSYTGENVVEINCHGGSVPVRRCLERCLQIGLRMAEPGEFTKRAFLNGRLGLNQAEAVIDLIRAKTERGLKLALQQLEGKNQLYIDEIENQLIGVNAMIEASLDFPEDVGELDYEEANAILVEVRTNLDRLIAAGSRGEIYRDGVSVVICGKPNVGKSSLLNALLRKEKAIVTEHPGTTRDVIEDYINIKGIPVKIMDTAGIRPTEEVIEKMGVQRSIQMMGQADLLIFLLDVGDGIREDDLDIYKQIDKDKLIVLVNKDDLDEKKIGEAEIRHLFNDKKVIRGSVKEETGLDELESAIEQMILGGTIPVDGMEIMLNQRQKYTLIKCREHVDNLINEIRAVTLDCLGVDTWGALENLGELKGRTLKDEVVDRIFHDFCIGK